MTQRPVDARRTLSGRSWLAVLAAIALAAATIWLLPAAEAKVGGYSEVVRLDLGYAPGSDVLEARFHLASGVALDQTVEDPTDADRLLRMADAFGQESTRMFVSAEEDQIRSWHLTVH